MGVQPFLVASSLMAVMAQRLIRTVCPKCGESYQPDQSELAFFDLTPEQIASATFRKGKGCKNCQFTGARGRKAVFELMMINAAIRDLAFRSEPAQNIRRVARQYGMKTLVEDAIDKALEGVSTLMEAYKLRSGGH
jgi:type IV pilus assembly protein PilB